LTALLNLVKLVLIPLHYKLLGKCLNDLLNMDCMLQIARTSIRFSCLMQLAFDTVYFYYGIELFLFLIQFETVHNATALRIIILY
jgi:hypothetical protein